MQAPIKHFKNTKIDTETKNNQNLYKTTCGQLRVS